MSCVIQLIEDNKMYSAFRLLLAVCLASSALAQEPAEALDTEKRMAEMSALIDGVTMEVVIDNTTHTAAQNPAALLRSIEIGRRTTLAKEDGSLWLWSHDGLPVAIVELWAQNDSHRWGHTLLAVSSEKMMGTVGSNKWKPKVGSGMKFKPVLKAGEPREKAALRKVQMRKISRRFKTNIDDPGQNNSQQFRLLTEPIHRYQGGDVQDGAVFAFVRGQSNAEVLLFVQARDKQWEYGFLRCSSNTLVAQLDGVEIWVAPQVPGWVGGYDEPFWVVHRNATNFN